MSNLNADALKQFVDRAVDIERTFADAKSEYTDTKKDFYAEVKARFDETGVDAKEVKRLAKIRMDEAQARETYTELGSDLEQVESLYGPAQAEDEV